MSRLSKRMRLILVTLSFVIVVAFVGVTWGIESVDAAKKITDSNDFLNRSLQGTGVPRSDVRDYIGVVIETALGIVSLLFLILMVYAGFTWMTARGEQDKIDKAIFLKPVKDKIEAVILKDGDRTDQKHLLDPATMMILE